MFDFFKTARKKQLNFDQLQTLQMVSQQVVLSLEGSIRIPGAAKKALALSLVGELLEDIGIVAPNSLVDTAIEASVRMLKALDAQPPASLPTASTVSSVPSFKLDVSGRPSTGNDKGLSL